MKIIINRIDRNEQRRTYKIKKAFYTVRNWKGENTAQLYLAEQKLMNAAIPNLYDRADRFVNVKKALKYYRKKYNNEGVTTIAERFVKSKPFINASKLMQFWSVKVMKKMLKIK